MRLSAPRRPPYYKHSIPAEVNGKGLEAVVSITPNQRIVGGSIYASATSAPSGYVFATFALGFRPPTLAVPGLWQIGGAGTTPLPSHHSEVDSARFAAHSSLPIRKRSFPANCQTSKVQQRPLAGACEHLPRGGILRLLASSSIPQRSAPWNCRPRGSRRPTFCQEVWNDARRC
jgi:hypothetical protein